GQRRILVSRILKLGAEGKDGDPEKNFPHKTFFFVVVAVVIPTFFYHLEPGLGTSLPHNTSSLTRVPGRYMYRIR
ncbi:hypothetical protein COCMIDRAFT_100338, partial [Bipolaris oryzae ATCC 44560]